MSLLQDYIEILFDTKLKPTLKVSHEDRFSRTLFSGLVARQRWHEFTRRATNSDSEGIIEKAFFISILYFRQ